MDGGVAAVFDTAELLEEVLLNLTAPDLMRARGISSTFRDTIAESHRLRKKLFLQPATLQHITELRLEGNDSDYSINRYDKVMTEPRGEEDASTLPQFGILNPFFFSCKQTTNPTIDMHRLLSARAKDGGKIRGVRKLLLSVKDLDGIATHMVITQPPAKRISFEVCLGIEKRAGTKPFASRLMSGNVVRVMAGGMQGMDHKALVERMQGIEEQVMEWYGFEIDWMRSKIELPGQVLPSSSLAGMLR